MDVLPGYTNKFGSKNAVVADIEGPDYYFTGGSEITPETFGLGLGAFDTVAFSVSQSGTYIAYARFEAAVEGEAAQTVKMVVCTLNGGAEVAYGIDLGAEIFRMFAIMV